MKMLIFISALSLLVAFVTTVPAARACPGVCMFVNLQYSPGSQRPYLNEWRRASDTYAWECVCNNDSCQWEKRRLR